MGLCACSSGSGSIFETTHQGRLRHHWNAAHLRPCCIVGIFDITGKIQKWELLLRIQRLLLGGWGGGGDGFTVITRRQHSRVTCWLGVSVKGQEINLLKLSAALSLSSGLYSCWLMLRWWCQRSAWFALLEFSFHPPSLNTEYLDLTWTTRAVITHHLHRYGLCSAEDSDLTALETCVPSDQGRICRHLMAQVLAHEALYAPTVSCKTQRCVKDDCVWKRTMPSFDT